MDWERVKNAVMPALMTGAYAAMASFLANKEADMETALVVAGLVLITTVFIEIREVILPRLTAGKGKPKRRWFLGYKK